MTSSELSVLLESNPIIQQSMCGAHFGSDLSRCCYSNKTHYSNCRCCYRNMTSGRNSHQVVTSRECRSTVTKITNTKAQDQQRDGPDKDESGGMMSMMEWTWSTRPWPREDGCRGIIGQMDGVDGIEVRIDMRSREKT